MKTTKLIKEKPIEVTEKPKIKNKELYWVLGIMLAIVVVFLASYSIFQSLHRFDYEGLTFTKERFGDKVLYHYYYYFPDTTGEVVKYNLYLRNDPRTNNATIEREIFLESERTTYLSINATELAKCPYSSVAISSIASFLSANMIPIRSATSEKELALENNLTYADCETHQDDLVLILRAGDKTEIERETPTCFFLTASNCEITQVVEKFQVEAIIDARARRGL
ncbi:MAG: hypothetical protein AABX73_04500 [Nanoarchaeota archaeon]